MPISMLMRILITFALFLLSGGLLPAAAQTDTAKAREKGKAAIQLIDNGEAAQALPLLEEAAALDPGNINYPYETAYARYRLHDFEGAIEVLKKLVKHKDVFDRVYQLLGNAYDNTGKRDKAIAAYDKGLRLFPESGSLYLERGVMELGIKEYSKALAYFETGIEADPLYPSNYYWAARLFLDSKEEVWGMIYGELFMNLERGSKRTEEISKQLYYTYKSEIQFPADTSVTVSFSKNNTIYISVDPKKKGANDLMDQLSSFKLPYGMGIYEPTLLIATAGEKIINLASLHRIRTRFLENYQQLGHQKGKPVVLFDFQREIKAAGHFEAYNYWLLGFGNELEMEDWRIAHPDQWDGFLAWFRDHRLVIGEENKFYRSKY